MPKQFNIDRFNKLLKHHNQTLQAEKITVNEIIFSNRMTLSDQRVIQRCKRRVMNGNNVWKENFDKLYGTNKQDQMTAEKECRSATSVRGGKECQIKHGNKIKENLNTRTPWNKGMKIKGNYPYSHSVSEETKEKIGIANSGEKNGMFGKKMSDHQKKHRSNLMKEKILSGEFTPNSNNRNTHWDSYYKDKKYRSSWEALYQFIDNDAEYESLRIPYMFNNQKHIYIVDFINHKTKSLIEVRPKELTSDRRTQAKIRAATQWCKENHYQFVLADKDYLTSKPKVDNFDNFDKKTQEKIRNLYETC